MKPIKDNWLIRLNAVVSHGTGSYTDNYAMSVHAASAAEATERVITSFEEDHADDERVTVTILPWAWRLGADARPVDQGHRVEAYEDHTFEAGD